MADRIKTKPPIFEQVSILGLGLIGGSIALDLKKRRLAKRVLGFNRNAKSRQVAKRRRACDHVFSDVRLAVRDADLIVLATPVQTIPKLVRRIAPFLKNGAVVTDVGSTKERLVREVNKTLSGKNIFVGGHPVAGTENSGMVSAILNLFQDRWWIFTPTDFSRDGKRALRLLRAWVRALGAKPSILTPKQHDQFLAVISHLPHAAAFSLMDTALKVQKGHPLKFAGGGFRDFTRIAASSPQMWADIFLDNSPPLLKMIGRFEKSLKQIKGMIRRNNKKDLIRFFENSSKVRKKL